MSVFYYYNKLRIMYSSFRHNSSFALWNVIVMEYPQNYFYNHNKKTAASSALNLKTHFSQPLDIIFFFQMMNIGIICPSSTQ